MKLYPIPGGGWAGTEADWKKGMKLAGYDPKAFEDTKTREVPTGKKELMEFLTFFGVDVYKLPAGTTVSTPAVDVAALRAEHNPDAPDLPPPAPPKLPADGASEATRQIAKMDNPGLDVDGIVEIICNSKGHALKRFAGAVSTAFSALAAA